MKSKRHSKSAKKINALEKLIKINSKYNSNQKSRNQMYKGCQSNDLRLDFYHSHHPEVDKISNILVKNCMKTHRSYKPANETISQHLHDYSYILQEKRNK
jgi:hypothetical protein